MKFEKLQEIFTIHNVKVGGQPGELPTVLIGTIFYEGHKIVKNPMKGEFDRKQAEELLKKQEELSDIENKIAYTRQFYNDSVLYYNNLVTTIPGMWFASLINKKQKPYLEVPREKKEVTLPVQKDNRNCSWLLKTKFSLSKLF